MISIISTFESGMDWKPSFDEVVGYDESDSEWKLFLKVVRIDFRNFFKNYQIKKIAAGNYFRVKEVGFNSIYAKNLDTLADLCVIAGDRDHPVFTSRAKQVKESMVKIMYDIDDSAFYDTYGEENIKIKLLTPTIFYPAVVKGMPVELVKNVIDKHMFNRDEFNLPFRVPSVAKKEKAFNPYETVFIWRGPVWIANNWFLNKILIEKGFQKESHALVNSTLSLIQKSGFREYYNPFTGEGYGAKNFTWSGLVADMIRDDPDLSS